MRELVESGKLKVESDWFFRFITRRSFIFRVRVFTQRDTEVARSYTEDLMPRRGYIIIENTYRFVS
jgi:hypothetical protein